MTRHTRFTCSAATDLRTPVLPFPAERDPERQHDELHVEPEPSATDVEHVLAELVTADDVARREDLPETSQARAHAVPTLVAADVRHVDVAAGRVDLDFPGPQRARPDKTHVAVED